MILEESVKLNGISNDKKRIVIISDTHITPTGAGFNNNAFNAGIEKINRIKNVSLFLHLGDITQNGTLLDYEYVLDKFKKFNPISKAPIFYLIGNHDAKNVGYLLFEEFIGERHFEYEDAYVYILGIDSTVPDLPKGVIHHNTINAVKKRLTLPEREKKLKVVCFHHQLIPIPNTGKERSAIDDSGDMLQMLLNAKADLVLNGHRHISNLYKISNSEKDLYIFNAGTFSSNKTRYRELFTYSIIDIINNNLNFKILQSLDQTFKREISRKINYYTPRNIKQGEKPFCKFIQLSNSLISKQSNTKITNFDKAIEEINKLSDVDLVIHTGNLTKNSYKEEFIIVKEKLNILKYPYLIVPGYTDSHPEAWKYWEHYIGDLDPLYENDKIYFKGINSTTPDSKIGFIGRKKLHKFLEKVLSYSHQKIFGVCCFHSLIPTPSSVWRTELIDSGDALSQFARSQIDLVLNNTPSISFNLKIENTIFSNGGNLKGKYFDEKFIEIDIYKDGLVILTEYNLKTEFKKVIGKYHTNILT
jgi:3',5'-cyclic AMP phosphodiesterase CpdA